MRLDGFLDRGWRPSDEVAAITLALAAANDQDPEPTLAWFTEAWRRHPAALSNWSPALIAVMRQDVQGQGRQTDEILDRILAAEDVSWLEAVERWRSTRADLMSRTTIESIDLALGLRGRSPASVDSETTAMQHLLAGGLDQVDAAERSPSWFLASRPGPVPESTLRRRAAEEQADARIALALRDLPQNRRVNERVLADTDLDLDRRIIAAGRLSVLDPPDDATLLNLLADGPANADGTVHGVALVARKGLSETARRRLVTRWLSMKDPDRRRGAIMIATLQDAETESTIDVETLATIQRLATPDEPDAGVRRTARLALRALARWPLEDVDPSGLCRANHPTLGWQTGPRRGPARVAGGRSVRGTATDLTAGALRRTGRGRGPPPLGVGDRVASRDHQSRPPGVVRGDRRTDSG